MNFFIFSLPRSGSAWLSVFLSGRNSFCYHEPTADHKLYELRDLADQSLYPIIGGVDTGAYCYANAVRTACPNAKFYALHRDPAEIDASVKNLKLPFSTAQEHEKYLKATEDCIPIYYSRFNDLDYLRELWQNVVGWQEPVASSFDPVRAQQLVEMNIQRDIRKFIQRRPILQRAFG